MGRVIEVVILLALLAFAARYAWPFMVVALVAYLGYVIFRYVRKRRYFASQHFQETAQEVEYLIRDHNELAQYIAEIRAEGSFDLGASVAAKKRRAPGGTTGAHKVADADGDILPHHIHRCSLQVVRKAGDDPVAYLMKYFGITSTREHLHKLEDMSENFVRLKDAAADLRYREETIDTVFAPPPFIQKHYVKEFRERVGLVNVPKIAIPYPVYVFEYVSAAGKTSQRTTITLDIDLADALMVRIGEDMLTRESVAEQRALMTAKFRRFIKERDDYTCQQCGVSVDDEPNLLLEIDHIIPLSHGGLSTSTNLQTLCWKCNRSKSNKVNR